MTAQTPRRRPPLARHRLLVADDAPKDRALLAAAVRRLRPAAEVVAAANADEALGALAMEQIDVVLIDFGRPGADGIELAALMRRSSGALPIAVISSQLQGDAWMRATELGAVFIPKPVTDDALAAFLARAELKLGH